MNVSSLFRIACQTVNSITPKLPGLQPFAKVLCRNMYYMCNKQYSYKLTDVHTSQSSSVFLQPSLPMYNIMCGLKMKTVLQRRCKGCIVMWRNDRKYIMCKLKPRHNQVERKKQEYKTWILTFASQSRKREW